MIKGFTLTNYLLILIVVTLLLTLALFYRYIQIERTDKIIDRARGQIQRQKEQEREQLYREINKSRDELKEYE